MVQEELSAEEEKGHVVYNPDHYEEPARVPQAVGDGCEQKSVRGTALGSRRLTFAENGNVPTLSKDACGEDTKDQEDGACGGPPANNVTDHVDLLMSFVLSPETDTLLGEWPRAR